MQKKLTVCCCALYVGWDSSCSVFQDDSSHYPNLLVNDSVLKDVGNDVQSLIDCLPPHGELILDVQQIFPKDVLLIEKSITIRSARSQTNNSKLRMKVEAKCPQGGCFEIRYFLVHRLAILESSPDCEAYKPILLGILIWQRFACNPRSKEIFMLIDVQAKGLETLWHS